MSIPAATESSTSTLPLVSVAMTAFNSEAWIGRAIESVLQQETAFVIELVIADDCSQDGTVEVVRRYQRQHPQLIRLLEREQNLGMQRNFFDTFEHCRGRYIAWLDADDYWTKPDKLAKQVRVLESDSSISVCGHVVRQVSATGEVVRARCPSLKAGRYGLNEIILSNFVPSPSIVFRNGVQRQLPEWYFQLRGLADWPILVQSALSGDIVLLDDNMADYVLTPNSAYMNKSLLHQEEADLEFCEHMASMLPSDRHRLAQAAKGKRHEVISFHHRKQKNYQAAVSAASRALFTPHPMDNFSSKIKAFALAGVLRVVSGIRGIFR